MAEKQEKIKLSQFGQLGRNWKKQEQMGTNGESREEKKHGKWNETGRYLN